MHALRMHGPHGTTEVHGMCDARRTVSNVTRSIPPVLRNGSERGLGLDSLLDDGKDGDTAKRGPRPCEKTEGSGGPTDCPD